MVSKWREAYIRKFIKDGASFVAEPLLPLICESPFATPFPLLLVIECPGCKVDLRSDIVNETSKCLSSLSGWL